MNNIEFFNEVKESEFCPSNWDRIYKEFEKYQKLSLDTLNVFHNICIENNIMYQVAYGSLLGAIRENGQIPWDYDVDVFVPYTSKDKLIEALNKYLPDEYYFYCPEKYNKCRHYVMRVCPKGYKSEALHVDVFYVAGAPNDEVERKKFKKEIAKCCNIRYWKLVKTYEQSEGKIKRTIKMLLIKSKYLFCSLRKANKRYSELAGKYAIGETKYVVTADLFSEWYDFPSELFTSCKKLSVDYGEVIIPENYEEMLTMVYKDYRTRPDNKKNLDELLRHYYRFKYFEKKRH